jgi:hypothetical protein
VLAGLRPGDRPGGERHPHCEEGAAARTPARPATAVAAGGEAGARRAARGGGRAGIGAEAFAGLDVRGRAVLVQANWDRHWGTDEYLSGGHPFPLSLPSLDGRVDREGETPHERLRG